MTNHLYSYFIFCPLQGSESLVGMDLDLAEINKELNISKITFKRMCNLQFLRFYSRFDDKSNCKLHSPKNLKYLSLKLRLLHWDYFPATCLPSRFSTEFLVELNMRNSKLTKLWEGVQVSDYFSLPFDLEVYIICFLVALDEYLICFLLMFPLLNSMCNFIV